MCWGGGRGGGLQRPFRVESCLALCSRVVIFLVLFSIVIISLWEERAGLCASRVIVCLFCTH